MKLIISAKLQGMFESYNILVDDEKVAKVRGNKTTTLEVEDSEHTLQLKGGSGKSSIIKISKPKSSDEEVVLNFTTSYAKAFKEGYFQLEDND